MRTHFLDPVVSIIETVALSCPSGRTETRAEDSGRAASASAVRISGALAPFRAGTGLRDPLQRW